MSSRAGHYREAERLLADTLDPTCVWEAGARERMIAAAHVRAQLSCMSDESYNDYLDLISEHLREEVVHMPGQDSRDWLKGDDDDDPGPTHGYWEEGDLPVTPGRPRKAVTLPPGAEARAAHIRALREQRDVAKEKLAHDTKVFVDRCVSAEIPVRDIAFLTGLTPQRISQISRS